MPIALNEKTGEVLRLDEAGQWVPTKIAENPETGEKLALDGASWVPVKKPEQSAGEAWKGFNDSVEQGASFGFMDEINAGIRSGIRGVHNLVTGKDADFGGNYDRALADERGDFKQFEEEHPVIATGANIAGGLISSIPLAGAAMGARTAAGVIGRGAASGAAAGAVGGFGAGEGGFENRAIGAGRGAAVGGVVGAALPVIAKVGSEAVKLGGNVLGLRNSKNVALDHLNRALSRDGVDPSAIVPDGTRPLALVDRGGENTTSLGRTVETIPGPSRNRAHEFLNERQLGQGERVGDDIGKGLSGDDFYKTLDDLDAQRKTDAAPLYTEAYKPKHVWSDEVETLTKDRPSVRQAMARAHKIAEEEGRDPKGLGLMLDADGNVKLEKTAASMQTLDYVKRGLDDVLNTFRDPVTGKLRLDEGGRAIEATRKRYVAELDRLNPAYKKAREAWGGPTQSMEAANLGRDFARGDAEATLSRFRQLSPGDQNMFRLGVARELKGIVENTKDGHDAVSKIFGSDGQRKRLKALFPDDASFTAFEKAMKDETTMTKTRRTVTGGSATGRIIAEQADAGALENAAIDYAGGGVKSVLFGLARRGAAKSHGLGKKSADDLSKMLFDKDQATQRNVLAELLRRQRQVEMQSTRNVGRVTTGMNALANASGQGLAVD
jgi:hypothetical protein